MSTPEAQDRARELARYYLEVDQPMLPTTIYVDDPNSDEPYPLASFYDQNRVPVEYDEVSTIMYDAILSSEDPRYYEHGGVDLIGTTRALINNATSSSTGSSRSRRSTSARFRTVCTPRRSWPAQASVRGRPPAAHTSWP